MEKMSNNSIFFIGIFISIQGVKGPPGGSRTNSGAEKLENTVFQTNKRIPFVFGALGPIWGPIGPIKPWTRRGGTGFPFSALNPKSPFIL